MLTAMTLAVPRRTNIPKSYGEMTKRHLMRTPFILLVGQLFPDGGSTTVVGASTMYWGITQCTDDNMTVLLVVKSTVLVVEPPIWSADR